MEAIDHAQETYADILARLNRASVAKRFDAYVDVPWDDPAARIDPSDPRWEQTADEPLGATAWYRAQPQAERARLGLAMIAYRMKRGMEFENSASRGLLEFALARPNGSADFRYAYHELIEEGQHSLMFQEFVNRSGCDVQPLMGFYRFMSRRVTQLGRQFPELFFVYVLAGELPIDQTQRALLRRGDAVHPVWRRITQIHVTEEARHVCFAHKYLAMRLPQLSRARRYQLRVMAPFIGVQTTRAILQPPRSFTRQLGIPDGVMASVHASHLHRELVSNALWPLYETYAQLGIVSVASAPLWQLAGFSAAQTPQTALPSATERLSAK
jgi:hypothetical protein